MTDSEIARDRWAIWGNAVEMLRKRGLVVEATDMPGLWRIDGYPELTTNQVMSLVFEKPST